MNLLYLCQQHEKYKAETQRGNLIVCVHICTIAVPASMPELAGRQAEFNKDCDR